MVEWCNHKLLAMLHIVVSEQQDDWDDQIPALLSGYPSTPHSSRGLNPYRIVYRMEMTMPLDFVTSDVGWEWPNVHYSTEYEEWLDYMRRSFHGQNQS